MNGRAEVSEVASHDSGSNSQGCPMGVANRGDGKQPEENVAKIQNLLRCGYGEQL